MKKFLAFLCLAYSCYGAVDIASVPHVLLTPATTNSDPAPINAWLGNVVSQTTVEAGTNIVVETN
jgi:hypothetical protein